ncbi:MAG: phage coat protein [Oscillospiraceae bacterium]|nr:phage coat protein [Oscillospiraceae bacterium]
MKTAKFSAANFSPDAFAYSVKRVKALKISELSKSKALVANPDIKCAFSGSASTGYARIVMRGTLDGGAVNYDGSTDIAPDAAKVFEQGVVVVGRAKGWVEKDFTYDSGGGDFMDGVAKQVAEYKDFLDMETLIATLKGVFSMSGDENEAFVDAHTLDISATGDGSITPVALNNAAFKACGANKKNFTVVLMHSTVATTLENMNLLEFMKYTDKEGITREIQLGTWSGRLVIVCDELPVTAAGTNTNYTSYILGEGAFAYEDITVKNAYELARDPKSNGGEDTLYMRQRKAFAPYGISYEKQAQASLSPLDTELADGENWTLANIDFDTYIDHTKIPIARIISRG